MSGHQNTQDKAFFFKQLSARRDTTELFCCHLNQEPNCSYLAAVGEIYNSIHHLVPVISILASNTALNK